jgi:uncharacterized damage-inducible protein DinB
MGGDLRYPIGDFDQNIKLAPEMRGKFINTIAELPAKLREAVQGLNEKQMQTPYRDGGWTVHQVIHHVADSHINSLTRFKLGLTEDTPTIKPYFEEKWAELADYKDVPVEVSFGIIDGIHTRWVSLLKSMTDADFAREICHPERGTMTLDVVLALYDWHSRHHTAHIIELRKRNQW